MKPLAIPAEILARFRSLALERTERIEAAWAALIKGEGDSDLAAGVQHELHTLKGDARMVGFTDVSRLCHKLEELFSAASARRFSVPEDFDLVATMAIRFMAMLLRKKEGSALAGIDVEGFVTQIDEVLAEERERPTLAPSSEAKSTSRPLAAPVEALDRISPATQQRLAIAATSVFLEHLAQPGRSRGRLRDVWLSLSAQVAACYAVRLDSRLARHAAAALDLAADLGKQAAVKMDLGDVCVRMDVAEAIDTAVLHMIRNALDHGLEDEAGRRRAGKSPAGRIEVRARALPDAVEVTIEDDGQGVDMEAVRRRGLELGLLSHESAGAASSGELLELLLQPGFTTRTRVSDISGRGIGLDAVRATLARAGGKLTLSTRRGEGTAACVRVPQASRRVEVRSFRALGADVFFAVPSAWSVSILPAQRDVDALDPVAALELDSAAERDPGASGAGDASRASGAGDERVLLQLRKGEREIVLLAGSASFTEMAERFCPTGDDHPVEVVLLRGAEALLLRPERLPGV
jgi:two-component system chemotaxis sensor kinase CheA